MRHLNERREKSQQSDPSIERRTSLFTEATTYKEEKIHPEFSVRQVKTIRKNIDIRHIIDSF